MQYSLYRKKRFIFKTPKRKKQHPKLFVQLRFLRVPDFRLVRKIRFLWMNYLKEKIRRMTLETFLLRKGRMKVFWSRFLKDPGDDLKGSPKSQIKANLHANFIVHYLCLNQSYIFNTLLACRCNTDCLCLVNEYSVDSDGILKSFSTACWLEKREIKDTSDYKILIALAQEKSITLGETIPTNKAKYDLLQLL